MDIRNLFFTYRSYTPIPLALMIIYFSQPAFPFIWYGLAFLLLGETVRFNAVRYAGGITRTTKVGAPSLCSSGPFSHVRNPLYLGNMLIFTGIVLLAGAPNIVLMLLITWVFFFTQYALIIDLEEETLHSLFGEEYQIYRQNVPQLLPRFTPWKSDDQRQPMSFSKTIVTEKRTLQNILLLIVFILIRQQFV